VAVIVDSHFELVRAQGRLRRALQDTRAGPSTAAATVIVKDSSRARANMMRVTF